MRLIKYSTSPDMENYTMADWFTAEQYAEKRLNGEEPSRWKMFSNKEKVADINSLCSTYEEYYSEYERTFECSKSEHYSLQVFYDWGECWIVRFFQKVSSLYPKSLLPFDGSWLERQMLRHIYRCEKLVTPDNNSLKVYLDCKKKIEGIIDDMKKHSRQ